MYLNALGVQPPLHPWLWNTPPGKRSHFLQYIAIKFWTIWVVWEKILLKRVHVVCSWIKLLISVWHACFDCMTWGSLKAAWLGIQSSSDTMHMKLMWFSPAQSTSCCSDRETRSPVIMACWPSREPVAEKAQQLPHPPYNDITITECLLKCLETHTREHTHTNMHTNTCIVWSCVHCRHWLVHETSLAWFLTGVTTLLSLQSIFFGRSLLSRGILALARS